MLKKQLKNSEMVVMVQNLRPLLQLRNKIGYIAARNFRMLSTALTEYEAFKHDLINKYGEPDRMKVATRPEPFPSRWALLILRPSATSLLRSTRWSMRSS